MISVNNLTKIYKSKKGAPCLALDGLSFTLPEKGMIFIHGKSGSGKSTLLNILGGLDTITGGDIIAGGRSLSSFNENELSNYRNSFVGFVFQEFCLIENFNVKENILLSLDLQDKQDEEALLSVTEKLEISDLLLRMPNELSGGQRQRVAIARAIIKKPSLVLADEPTGNLDSKSSAQVLETLKLISKESLVVVVSHNPDDALKYGDRIIEIADGKIVSDLTRNPNAPQEITIGESEIILPDKNFSEQELLLINEKISPCGVTVRQAEKQFSATAEVNAKSSEKFNLSPSRLPIRRAISASFALLKAKWLGFIVSVFMASAVIIMFGLCQLFASFDGDKTINETIRASQDKTFVMQKGYISDEFSNDISTDGLVAVQSSDIEKFYNDGYSGNVYPLINFSFPISRHSWKLESYTKPSSKEVYRSLYAQEIMGVLITDEPFLTSLYGDENGNLTYLSRSSAPKDYGMVITDFVADSISYYHPAYDVTRK